MAVTLNRRAQVREHHDEWQAWFAHHGLNINMVLAVKLCDDGYADATVTLRDRFGDMYIENGQPATGQVHFRIMRPIPPYKVNAR